MKKLLLPFLLATALYNNNAKGQTITTIAGYGVGDGGIAIMAELYQPISVTLDPLGNVYFADPSQSTIRKINTHGIITTIAGNRVSGFNGDGMADTLTEFNHPTGIRSDGVGNIYIADYSNNRVRKINFSGIVSTVAGTGAPGYSGDGSAATAAKLVHPSDIAFDTLGNLYIADQGNNRIRKIDHATGKISTVAGTGSIGWAGDGGPAVSAKINFPVAITTDSFGNVYFVDNGNNAVRKINAAGTITTVAGLGASTGGYSGDGGPATDAELANPAGISVERTGKIYISDNGNNRIRVVSTSGIISTYAGIGVWGFSGDGGPADSARIYNPCGSVIDPAGNFYFADNANERVRRVSTSGTITTIAGQNGTAGDGGPATAAGLSIPLHVAVDKAGNVYVADYGNDRIKKINTAGIINTIAGNGTIAHSGDGGPADSASIYLPSGMTTDTAGNLYFSELQGNTVRKISTSGTITTIAGNGSYSFSGDGGLASTAGINSPAGLSFDGAGNLYVADKNNNRIRKIDHFGFISTICGTGTAGYSGDGAAAVAAQINLPADVFADDTGNIFIADEGNNCIRKINTSGIITTIAGTGLSGYSGDGAAATAAKLNGPQGVTADTLGNVYIADYGNSCIRRVMPSGLIYTLGGTGISGYSGDGGPAYRARLYSPVGITMTGGNSMYIADSYNNKIRRIDSCTNAVPNAVQSVRAATSSLDIYPNPTNGRLKTAVPAALLPGVISIRNVAGQVILSFDQLYPTETFDISLLPDGLYLVVYQNKTGISATTKLIKQN